MGNGDEFSELGKMVLAPWIAKATALRGVPRKVGGNQFRHVMATMAILVDYHHISSLILKSAIIHDLIEDIPSTNICELSAIDNDSPKVIILVSEVTRRHGEDKPSFLKRIKADGTREAKLIKCADRISNLTDLHDFCRVDFIRSYLLETEEYIYDIADEVDSEMAFEIRDLVERKKRFLPENSGL